MLSWLVWSGYLVLLFGYCLDLLDCNSCLCLAGCFIIGYVVLMFCGWFLDCVIVSDCLLFVLVWFKLVCYWLLIYWIFRLLRTCVKFDLFVLLIVSVCGWVRCSRLRLFKLILCLFWFVTLFNFRIVDLIVISGNLVVYGWFG